MRRALLGSCIALAVSCARPAPPDPCPGLHARFETERTLMTCQSTDECVLTVTITDAPPAGQMGATGEPPCTPATHRDALARVAAAVHAFEAAGCGRLVPIRATCGHWGHGQHLACVEHRCEALY